MTRSKAKTESEGKAESVNNGYMHEIKCSTANCDAWVNIWLPKQLPTLPSERSCVCGICASVAISNAQHQIDQLSAELQQLKRQLHTETQKREAMENGIQKVDSAATEKQWIWDSYVGKSDEKRRGIKT